MFVAKAENTYKVYEQGNAIRKTIDYGEYWLPQKKFRRLEGFSVNDRDIIVSCAGTIGETFVVPKNAPEGVINQALLRLTLNPAIIDEQYFLLMFKSLVDTLKANAVGSAIKNLASIKFLKYETPFLLPPLNEQRRIALSIKELIDKVEEYSIAYKKLEKVNKTFPKKLQKSILQYAMQGKLVPQNPNDEPVEVLLEKIRLEKQRLFKDGKLKKKDLEESIIYKGDDNSYYEKIPKSWILTTLGHIGVWGAGATPSRSNLKFYNGCIPWLKTGDLTDSYIFNIPEKITDLAVEKTSVKLNPTNSVLIAMYGATIGKLGILTYPATTNQACCACQPISEVDNLFLFYYLMSYRKHFIDSAEGGAQPNISRIKIVGTPFPLPTKQEQIMIVERVEKCFELVNQL